MKKLLIPVVILFVLGGGYVVLNGYKSVGTQDFVPFETGTPVQSQTEETPPDAIAAGQVKEFAVDGQPFSYSLKEMRVKKGDTVRVTFTNKQGLHDWGIAQFSARTKQLAAGASETIEFVARETGTFEYYCSVGNHQEQGMSGKLIVE